MATNIITVKDVQEKSRDGSTWLELIDQENRTHRIFRRVQDNEGNWHDLSSKYEMLRSSLNRTLKLTTEQKGKFVNVVDVESVERAAPGNLPLVDDQEAACRLRTFTTAYAKDLAVAGKIPTDAILAWSELFYRYLQGYLTVSDDELDNILKKVRGAEEAQIRSGSKRTPARVTEDVGSRS
jgi:hypothetical protein